MKRSRMRNWQFLTCEPPQRFRARTINAIRVGVCIQERLFYRIKFLLSAQHFSRGHYPYGYHDSSIR